MARTDFAENEDITTEAVKAAQAFFEKFDTQRTEFEEVWQVADYMVKAAQNRTLNSTEMAKGVKSQLGTDVGIATSGIAGPSGGTKEKPVGTIWIAIAIGDEVHTRELKLFKDRVLNIKATAVASLSLLWRILYK